VTVTPLRQDPAVDPDLFRATPLVYHAGGYVHLGPANRAA
jgi:hypothetical protein